MNNKLSLQDPSLFLLAFNLFSFVPPFSFFRIIKIFDRRLETLWRRWISNGEVESTERQRKAHSDFADSEVVYCIAILGWALKRRMRGLAQIPALSLGTSASKVLTGRFFENSEVVNFWGSGLSMY